MLVATGKRVDFWGFAVAGFVGDCIELVKRLFGGLVEKKGGSSESCGDGEGFDGAAQSSGGHVW